LSRNESKDPGNDVSMIFQEPMNTPPLPFYTVADSLIGSLYGPQNMSLERGRQKRLSKRFRDGEIAMPDQRVLRVSAPAFGGDAAARLEIA
jgi:ABC-type microcin C transport system duplicated ATPase subunit YejF